MKYSRIASETILKIWEHRAALPSNAYPLAQFADTLRILESLTPKKNPWARFAGNENSSTAAKLHELFSKLFAQILSLESFPSGRRTIPAVAVNALSRRERLVIESLEKLFEGVAPSESPAKLSPTENARGLIRNLIEELAKLDQQLSKPSKVKRKSRSRLRRKQP